MEDAETEGADCVVGGYTGVVGVGDGYACVGVGDVCYDCVEKEAGIVGFQEFGSDAFEEGVKATGIDGQFVVFVELVEGGVVAGDAEDEGVFFWWMGAFEIWSLVLAAKPHK